MQLKKYKTFEQKWLNRCCP